ncbi:hypothetical protein K1718_13345 [Roseibium porphyridii]|uniref:Multidrug transporter n=1 Tax=Roseibium porphyridii TaxID=2866279 RepID=A0ABY8FCD4_9HYPH|nr:hypothetical protein [Roseibium sp. KMA01]WFE92304.1 hypothetical protein K1718_13345 [Roseibium sp. KMA01]
MTDKPYSPRLGGRYERDPETGKRKRVEETGQSAPKKPAPAKSDKPAQKSRKET